MLLKRDDDGEDSSKNKQDKADSYGERLRGFFRELFGKKETAIAVEDSIDKAVAGLAESVKSIAAPGDEQNEMLAETFAQFHEHLSDEVAKAMTNDRAPSRTVTTEKENAMSPELAKALGLKEDASEQDALKAVAELNKARKPPKKNDDDDDEEEEEKKKAFDALPEHIRKQLDAGAQALIEVAKLRDAAELESMRKRAVDTGLPDAEGETLLKAFRGDREAVEKLLGFAKQGFAAAREAGAFKEIGSSRNDGAGASALAQITAKAAELRKSMPHLSEAQAFDRVYSDTSNRELARRERADNAPRYS